MAAPKVKMLTHFSSIVLCKSVGTSANALKAWTNTAAGIKQSPRCCRETTEITLMYSLTRLREAPVLTFFPVRQDRNQRYLRWRVASCGRVHVPRGIHACVAGCVRVDPGPSASPGSEPMTPSSSGAHWLAVWFSHVILSWPPQVWCVCTLWVIAYIPSLLL